MDRRDLRATKYEANNSARVQGLVTLHNWRGDVDHERRQHRYANTSLETI
jgi:hypothetical protein